MVNPAIAEAAPVGYLGLCLQSPFESTAHTPLLLGPNIQRVADVVIEKGHGGNHLMHQFAFWYSNQIACTTMIYANALIPQVGIPTNEDGGLLPSSLAVRRVMRIRSGIPVDDPSTKARRAHGGTACRARRPASKAAGLAA
jgi:hypothetical protein